MDFALIAQDENYDLAPWGGLGPREERLHAQNRSEGQGRG